MHFWIITRLKLKHNFLYAISHMWHFMLRKTKGLHLYKRNSLNSADLHTVTNLHCGKNLQAESVQSDSVKPCAQNDDHILKVSQKLVGLKNITDGWTGNDCCRGGPVEMCHVTGRVRGHRETDFPLLCGTSMPAMMRSDCQTLLLSRKLGELWRSVEANSWPTERVTMWLREAAPLQGAFLYISSGECQLWCSHPLVPFTHF